MKKVTVSIILVLSLVLLASCMTAKQPYKSAGITTALVEKDYEILGEVQINAKITNIIGLFTFGGKGYAELLEEAKKVYPETDAVINIYEDTTGLTVLGIYNTWGKKLTATAVKFVD